MARREEAAIHDMEIAVYRDKVWAMGQSHGMGPKYLAERKCHNRSGSQTHRRLEQ